MANHRQMPGSGVLLASTARPSQVEGASENTRAMPETMGTMSNVGLGWKGMPESREEEW